MSSASADRSKARLLLRVVRPLQKSVVNPLVRLAFRWGVADPGDALLETVGRRSGRPRRRALSRGNLGRRICFAASGAATTGPLTIRVDLDAVPLAPPH